MIKATLKQLEYFKFIKNYIAENKYPPSIRDISAGMGVTPKATIDTLKVLEKKGYIKRSVNTARGITINDRIADKRTV